MSNQILEEDLNQSLRLIVQGRENFLKATNCEMRQQSYSQMKKGCGDLLTYIRHEKDENIKTMMSQQLKRYIDELNNFSEAMKINQQTEEVEVVQVKKQELLYTQESNKEIQLYNAQYAKYVEIHQVTQNNTTQIIGLESQKQILNERIGLPLLFPQLFQGNRKLQTSTLLYGPRGTGKTELLRQIASDCKALLIIVNISMIIELEEQNTVSELMNQIEQQTKNKSFIIVLKQLEECKNREKLIQFFEKYNLKSLVESERLASNVIGCTNQPWKIHHSVRRIFENRVEFTLMSEKQRLEFINHKLFQFQQYKLQNNEIAELAKITNKFTGMDLKNLFTKAIQIYEQKQYAKTDVRFLLMKVRFL